MSQLADFMRDFNGKLAKEVARLVDWKYKVWARRYTLTLRQVQEGALKIRGVRPD
jgi:hypothetical protein